MRRILGALLLALGVAGSTPATTAAKEAPADLGSVLAPLAAKHDVPALAAAVITSKGVIAQGVTGVRKRGDETKATLDDLWHLGSCGKAMTATLIGRLVEQKKLRFEMTLPEAFPDLAKTMHAGWRKVTLAQLLSNRGGMPADLRKDGLWMRLYAHTGTPREARRLLTATVLSWAPTHKPGTDFEYSNAGFAVAGHAAECLLDTAYETLLVREVFKPLGATSVGFGAPGAGAKTTTQPWGHAFMGTGRPAVDPAQVAADNPPAITPAGRMHMTLADWARFVHMHLLGARSNKSELPLDHATLRKLQTPDEGQRYAMGWVTFERPWAGGTAIMHNGSNTMWYALMWIAPKRDVAFIAVCNQGGEPGNVAADTAIGALIAWHQKQTTARKPKKD